MKTEHIHLIACAFLASFIAATAVSCEKDGTREEADPGLSTTVNGIAVAAEGGIYTIDYILNNPVDGGEIGAECLPGCDWISNLVPEDGKLSFTAAANISDTIRTTSIVITYSYPDGEASCDVTVTQEAGKTQPAGAFALSVSGIKAASAFCQVTPEDNTMPFITMTVEQSKKDGMTDQEWFEHDMEYFTQLSANYGESLTDYLEQYRIKSGYIEFTTGGLVPGEDYYLYAYGINTEGASPALTTEVNKTAFTTTCPEPVDNEIVLEVEINGADASIIAVPWNDNILYYADWMSESILEDAGYTEGSIEERLVEWTYDWMSVYLAMGMYAIEDLGVYGKQSVPFKIEDLEDTYYAFAYLLNDDATAGSEVFLRTITDGTDVN